MQHKTIEIEGFEGQFFAKSLKFRDQEKIIELVSDISEGASPKQQTKSVREAISICVEGWSLSEPIEEWDTKLDLVQAVRLVHACLSANQASEGDRKK